MPWNNAGPGPWGAPGGSSGGGHDGGRGEGREDETGKRHGGPQGPWGGGPGRSPGGGPDLDQLLSRLQSYLGNLFAGKPGRGSGGRLAALAVAVGIVIWLSSGFYRVQPDEQGVVLRFGAYVRTTMPGLNYHLPWPIETVIRPAVTRINRLEVGYRSDALTASTGTARPAAARDVPAESLMLTGDENIVDINFAVFWRIRDAREFLFDTRDPQTTVRSVAESVMREIIAQTPIDQALTQRRAQIEQTAMRSAQSILDSYRTGVEVTQVQLLKVDPPAAVIDSFRDVQRATTDAERMRNEADAYRNDIVPRARGEAARIVAEAEGAKQAAIAQASGEAQQFDSILKGYEGAKDITLRRMYIETMQDVLSKAPSVIVDGNLKGFTPLLPLGGLRQLSVPHAPTAGNPVAGAAAPATTQKPGSKP